MRRLIGLKRYDTATADRLHTVRTTNPEGQTVMTVTLCRGKATGDYFLWTRGQPGAVQAAAEDEDPQTLEPISTEQAAAWAEGNMARTKFATLFGAVIIDV